VRSAPKIDPPTITDRTDTTTNVTWTLDPEISEYQIYRINKDDSGKSRLDEVVWHGITDTAAITDLTPYTDYTFTLIGYIENGVTNTQEFNVHTRLQAPTIHFGQTKTGMKSAVVTWNPVPRNRAKIFIIGKTKIPILAKKF